MAGTIGSMTVFAKVDTRQFSKGIEKTKSMTKGLASSFSNLRGGIQAAVAGAGVMAFSGLISSITLTGDELAKASKRVGMTTDDFQSLRFAVEQSGGRIQNIEMAMKTLNSQMLVAKTSGGQAQMMFDMLGISLENLYDQNQAEKFRTMLHALAGIEDKGLRAGLAIKLFGRAGQTFAHMAEDLDGLEKEFAGIGALIETEDIQSAEELADIFNRIRLVFVRVGSEIGTAVLPIIEAMEPIFIDIGVAIANVINFIGKMIKAFSKLSIPGLNFIPGIFLLKQLGNLAGLANEGNKKTPPKPAPISTDMLDATEDILDSQKATTKKLTELNRTVADLPPSLQAGNAATVTAINKLIRKNNEQRVVNELKKMQEIEDDQLDELRKSKRLQTSFVLRPV